MKIGVIAAVLPPELGGLGETVWAKHRWLAAKGIDGQIVSYSARETNRTGDEEALGPEVTRYAPVARVGGRPIQKLRDLRAMAPLLHQSLADCDLIEMQGWSLWITALALFPGPLARKPWIMVYRGTDGWEYRPRSLFDLKRRVSRRAYTLANSAGLADHLRGLGIRVDGHIWSEVDTALFDLPEQAPEPGHLVSVKGLYPVGDPETLVRALAILKERGIPFRYTHLGMGPLREPMIQLCRSLSIDKEVTFLGKVPHGEIPGYMRRAAIKVLSSRRESCPHVVGEAMMMARPVVATATTGASELIEDGRTGLLSPIGDPRALADRISRLLADPEEARQMGLRGRAWARENLHVDVVFSKYLALYRKLLK